MHVYQKKYVPLHSLLGYNSNMQSGCSAVGSALRSGRRGRKFESCHPDLRKSVETIVSTDFFIYRTFLTLNIFFFFIN